jgi:lipoyl(octanoyl) transferase
MRFETWPALTPYAEGLAKMEAAVAEVLAGGPERLIFCEHAPVFTTGTSADPGELLNPGDIPVIDSGRGGKTTYHGPGQRVVYPILRLHDRDLRAYIKRLQAWLIATLADLDLRAFATDDIGVWLNASNPSAVIPAEAGMHVPDDVAKIAAIGIRIRQWVAFHGIALNVNPDLANFQRIKPCGLDKPVTSLYALGLQTTLAEIDTLLKKHSPILLPH